MTNKYGIPVSVAKAMLHMYEWRWSSQDMGPVSVDIAQVALDYYGESDLEKLLDLEPELTKSNEGVRGFSLKDEALAIQDMVIVFLKDDGSPIPRPDHVMHFTVRVTDMVIDTILEAGTLNLEVIEEVLIRTHFVAAFRRVESHKRMLVGKENERVRKEALAHRNMELVAQWKEAHLAEEARRAARIPKPGDWVRFARKRCQERVPGYSSYTTRYIPARGFEDRLPASPERAESACSAAKEKYDGPLSMDMFEPYNTSIPVGPAHLLTVDGGFHQRPLWPEGHFDS